MSEDSISIQKTTIREVFNPSCQYTVPHFQRAYKWEWGKESNKAASEEEEIKLLIRDIELSLNKPSPAYFIGTIVVWKSLAQHLICWMGNNGSLL